MHTAYLIHWNSEEAKPRASILRRSGFRTTHILPKGMPSLKIIAEKPGSVVVIDLSRLPSQGRDIAILLRRNGRTRHIPLVFADGEPDKLPGIKKHLPDATYSTWNKIGAALKRALKAKKEDLVVPKSSLAGYSGTPLPAKLGIKPNSTIALINAPEDFSRTLGRLPKNVTLVRNPRGKQQLTLWFATSLDDYQSQIRILAALSERMWVIWPKKSSGISTDMSEQTVRDVGLAIGLVDYKVCAVDSTWSGLLFTHRKKEPS
jgi:hypothetical protein